jgi:hypothetical protein
MVILVSHMMNPLFSYPLIKGMFFRFPAPFSQFLREIPEKVYTFMPLNTYIQIISTTGIHGET